MKPLTDKIEHNLIQSSDTLTSFNNYEQAWANASLSQPNIKITENSIHRTDR